MPIGRSQRLSAGHRDEFLERCEAMTPLKASPGRVRTRDGLKGWQPPARDFRFGPGAASSTTWSEARPTQRPRRPRRQSTPPRKPTTPSATGVGRSNGAAGSGARSNAAMRQSISFAGVTSFFTRGREDRQGASMASRNCRTPRHKIKRASRRGFVPAPRRRTTQDALQAADQRHEGDQADTASKGGRICPARSPAANSRGCHPEGR